MKHLSLFTGFGGFDLAAWAMNWENVLQVENNDFCLETLKKNFKNVKKLHDIKNINLHEYKNKIDIITGGFPCQPFSTAGLQKGMDDERWLWEEMFRIVKNVQPSFVLAENVRGFINNRGGLAMEKICNDLETEGYEVQPLLLPASSIGALHQRQRIFIFAFSLQNRRKRKLEQKIEKRCNNEKVNNIKSDSAFSSNSDRERCESGSFGSEKNETWRNYKRKGKGKRDWWSCESELMGIPDGLSSRLDKNRAKRIEGLGNAVVPQLIFEIFKIIEIFDKKITEL